MIGSDDSGGAGCIAGPVVVASCCVMKPFSSFLPLSPSSAFEPSSSSPLLTMSPVMMDAMSKVNDSKMLTPTQRQEIYDIIISNPEIFAVCIAQRSPMQIDELNLTHATMEAFAESIENLALKYDFPFEEVYAIVDGKFSPKLFAPSPRSQLQTPTQKQPSSKKTQMQADSQTRQPNVEERTTKRFSVRPYVDGDAHVYTVALSSIVAKVTRDAMMQNLHAQYPNYGFDLNLGYGTREHVGAIHQWGSVEGVHRMSFKQVKGH